MENRVRVQHYRVPSSFTPGLGIRYYRGSGFANIRDTPQERGGLTEACVTIGPTVYYSRAKCSVKDSFCYRIGRAIAVGRLRKQIEPLGYTITDDGFVEDTDAAAL